MKNQLPLCVQIAFINTISGELRSPKDNAITLTYSEHGYRFGITASLDGSISIAYATYCDSPMNATSLADIFSEENVQTITQKLTEWVSFWNERLNPTKEEEEPKTEEQKPIVEVVFRMEENESGVSSPLCVFRNSFREGFGGYLVIDAYAHIGQHTEASYAYINEDTREATPEEYASLLSELKWVYADCTLKIVKRLHSGKWYSDHIIAYTDRNGERLCGCLADFGADTKKEAMKKLAREDAIAYSHEMDKRSDLLEIARINKHFERLGRQYGLLREFHENGIC